jgi:hypothetical protein
MTEGTVRSAGPAHSALNARSFAAATTFIQTASANAAKGRGTLCGEMEGRATPPSEFMVYPHIEDDRD